ncbi:MAG TPA: HPr(Ser) kinase/phosphatase [Chromatiaceae bacterium]|nr:HPr(Ser) kinase/phosphatase [Chromatiaceae bacterium]
MTEELTTAKLFGDLSDTLGMEWIAGRSGRARHIRGTASTEKQSLVGSLNCIHGNRIQLISGTEQNYLHGLSENSYKETLDTLFKGEPAAIIVTDNLMPARSLRELAEATGTPLIKSSHEYKRLLSHLQYYLTHALAERETIHGVFMEVLGMGVLLTGSPSIGKSELALELIARGHRLIADDAPLFSRIAPDIVSGTCPPLLHEFLEVRGLGILNIRAMFGDSAIKQMKYLRLIIQLENLDSDELMKIDRLSGSHSSRTILGLEIPQVTIPVAPGRNIAILIETAVRNHALRLKGYSSDADFIERQRSEIERRHR